jgi:two pore calcium channel protein 1
VTLFVFGVLSRRYISMFTLMTTANYPDVMMPAYHNNHFAPIFFILYMLFGFYFLLSLILGMVFSEFTSSAKDKYRKIYLHRREACRRVYLELYDDSGRLDAEMDFGVRLLPSVTLYRPL